MTTNQLKPGDRVGGYVLEALLGRGAMGTVYVGRNEAGARHAIKVPHAMTPARLARFEREMRVLAKLSHTNVVGVHSAGTQGGLAWCALELIEGEGLDHTLARGPLAVNRALEIGEAIARALAHAHEQGVLHRDVKPANILLRASDGSAVLTDFGIARDAAEERLTRTGDFVGSPHYMAPEQAAGKRDVDGRADVYGLGATLFEAIAGRPLFEADQLAALWARIASEVPPPLDRVRGDVSPAVAGVVQKALEKDPARRYATAAALALDLARARRGEATEARPSSAVARAFGSPGRRLAAGALAGLAIATAIAVAVFALDARRDTSGGAVSWLTTAARARDQVVEARAALRRGRLALDTAPPVVLDEHAQAFDRAVAAVTEVEGGEALRELKADVARGRALGLADAALGRGDAAAARLATRSLAVTDPERAVVLALADLADGKPAEARAALATLAEKGDPVTDRLVAEAKLGVLRAEVVLGDPRAVVAQAERLQAAFSGRGAPQDLVRAAQRVQASAFRALAVRLGERGSDECLQNLDAVARIDRELLPEAARETARAIARGWENVGHTGSTPAPPGFGNAAKDLARTLGQAWKDGRTESRGRLLVALQLRDPRATADPALVEFLTAIALTALDKPDFRTATLALESVARADPDALLPLAFEARLGVLLGDPKSDAGLALRLQLAAFRLGTALQMREVAERLTPARAEEAFKDAGDDWAVHVARAHVLLAIEQVRPPPKNRKSYERAEALCSQALQDPKLPAGSRYYARRTRAWALRQLGGRVADEIAELVAATEDLAPEPDVVLVELSRAYVATGRVEEAIRAAERALAAARDRHDRTLRGPEALGEGRPRGRSLLPVNLTRRPVAVQARAQLLDVLVWAGRVDEARAAYSRVPPDEVSKQARDELKLFVLEGRLPEAIAAAAPVARASSESVDAVLGDVASSLEDLGRKEDARRLREATKKR